MSLRKRRTASARSGGVSKISTVPADRSLDAACAAVFNFLLIGPAGPFEAHLERVERSVENMNLRAQQQECRCRDKRCAVANAACALICRTTDSSCAALMNRFYSHGADLKKQKVRRNTSGRQNRRARQLNPDPQRGRKPYRPPSCVWITSVSPARTGAAVIALPSVLARPTNSPLVVERKCTKP